MRRDLVKRILAAGLMGLGVAVVITAGVGCGSSWPEVHAGGEKGFITGSREVRTIDVMPSDVQIWAHDKSELSEEQIGRNFDAHVAGLVPTLLARRGYGVVGNLDWDGGYVNERGIRRVALTHEQMAETAWALSSYGVASERAKKALFPHLPHRLGAVTGADATLYVGGWGYAGKKKGNTGLKVLKTVAVVLVVAVAVIAVAAVLDGKGGKIGSGVGKVAGGVAKAGGHAAKSAARVAGGIGRATIAVTRGSARVLAEAARVDVGLIHIESGDRDCFGRVDTHVAWTQGRPNYHDQKDTPTSGSSASLIEMTLVDNRRGVVLWHARQRFPASPAKPADIGRMLGEMVASLPAH